MDNIEQHPHPSLTPIIHPWVKRFCENKERIDELMRQYGSPVNVHNTLPFEQNHTEYTQVVEKYGVKSKIMFARKANKSKVFVKAAREIGAGVDTASLRELKQCLQLNLDPQDLVVTAAIKTRELLELAVQHNVLIILDNKDELALTKAIAAELGRRARIGVRVSGFVVDGEKLYSRFGFDVDVITQVIKDEVVPFEEIEFRGMHFHLNGYSMKERSVALIALLQVVSQLEKENIKTYFIDIGGGLLINYLESESQWNGFIDQLKLAVQGERAPITFGNDGLGFKMINGKLEGQLSIYPYFNHHGRATFLDKILSFESDGKSIGAHLKEKDIELRIEPGRSLLDQCGITLARVVFRKTDSRGDLLVGLEMNRTQLFSSSADFLLDPTLISSSTTPKVNKEVYGYFVGAFCLEQDIILKRRIKMPFFPAIGDVVCFFNTAGYMMHFYESEAHLFDLSKNLVATNDSSLEHFDLVEDD